MLNELDEFRDLRLRRNDFTLSSEQELMRDSFAASLAKACPTGKVRAAEAGDLGFDRHLWDQLVAMGVVSMGVPEATGGDGGSLVDLALVAEELGRSLAPAPFVEAVVATRLLADCTTAPASDWVRHSVQGKQLVTLALHVQDGRSAQIVPGGAVADAVVGVDGDDLVLVTRPDRPSRPANLASSPLASWDLADGSGERLTLATGPAARASFDAARREWKLLTAAALVGLADGALHLATQYANDRHAFGVPIGAFQAISHRIVDVAIAVAGTRRLVWKAAWFADNEPSSAPELVPMAFAAACETAEAATTVGVHVQGGFGVTLDSDMQLFFRRAKGWPLVAGDPRSELTVIADLLSPPTDRLTG